MSEWVAVCADEAEEPVEIPTEADGELVSTFAKIPTKGEHESLVSLSAILMVMVKFLICIFGLCAQTIIHSLLITINSP